jgi:hypothetical protein
MTAWHEHQPNRELLERLRESLVDRGRLLVFLGAGLSFGAARVGGRARFDNDKYRWPPFDPPWHGLHPGDDDLPLPSWPWLIGRMHRRLLHHTDLLTTTRCMSSSRRKVRSIVRNCFARVLAKRTTASSCRSSLTFVGTSSFSRRRATMRY